VILTPQVKSTSYLNVMLDQKRCTQLLCTGLAAVLVFQHNRTGLSQHA
jgi:hypothetical protein